MEAGRGRAATAERGWLAVGIACAWVAQAVLRGGRPGWGIVAALAMVAALRLARPRGPEPEPVPARFVPFIAALCFLVALAVRGWRPEQMPPVLWDEAIQAYDARCLAAGTALEPLDGIGYHRGPAWSWTLAIAGKLLGWSYGSLRLVSGLIGSLAVALVFAVGARWFGILPAAVAAGWMALHPWPVHLSRLLLGNGTVALAGAAIVWLATTTRFRLARRAAVAGAVAGLSLWGYAAALFLPVLAAAAVLLAEREPLRRRIAAACLALAVAAAIGLPAAMTPGMWAKAGQVSVLSRPGQMAGNFIATAGLFHVAGDPDLRHNYPAGVPVFDALLGPVFTLGLGVVLLGFRRRDALLLGWLILALLPGIASSGGGRDLFRDAGAVPPVALLVGAGASVLPAALGAWTGSALAAALVLGSTSLGLERYAVLAPADRSVGVWYRTWAAEAGRDLATRCAREPVRFCTPLSLARHSVEKYALFDALHGAGAETGVGAAPAFVRAWEDSYGQPQALLLGGRPVRDERGVSRVPLSYRTVQDLAGECDALVRGGKPKQAAAGVRAALGYLPQSAILWERLGFAQLAGQDAREAERAFRTAIRIGARVPSVWDGLASALFRQGRRAEAEAAVREALKLAPDDPDLRADLDEITGRR